MLKEANGEGLSAAQEADRLKALSMQAMKEAVQNHENSVRAFQIAAMLASEAAAVQAEGAL